MPTLLDKMREGRKSPQVLRVKLIEIRSAKPQSRVFFFESHDDIPVYEDWIARTAAKPSYEPVPGSGKEQLLALQILLEQEGNLTGVYFFVDHDFDEEDERLQHVFVLDAYSIENLLCNEAAVESVLVDEFRCAGQPAVRERVLQAYANVLSQFEAHSRPLHERLFIARRERLRVNRRPDEAREFLRVTVDMVTPRFESVDEILEVRIELDAARLAGLQATFLSLPATRSCRGKYVLQVFRLWLRALAEDRRSAAPSLFQATGRFPGAPEQVSLRRLASSTPVPNGLQDFLAAA